MLSITSFFNCILRSFVIDCSHNMHYLPVILSPFKLICILNIVVRPCNRKAQVGSYNKRMYIYMYVILPRWKYEFSFCDMQRWFDNQQLFGK